MDINTTGGRIRLLRKRYHLTQNVLAMRLGGSYSLICSYENGTRNPSPEKLVQLADIFHVTTDYLLCKRSLTSFEDDILVSLKGLTATQQLSVQSVIAEYKKANRGNYQA